LAGVLLQEGCTAAGLVVGTVIYHAFTISMCLHSIVNVLMWTVRHMSILQSN
jgi:hypothetical protein